MMGGISGLYRGGELLALGFRNLSLSDIASTVSSARFEATIKRLVYAPKVTGKTPDGRLIREPNPNSIAMVVLVDEQGRIRDYLNGLNEGRWMRMIDEMLHE